MAGQSTNTVESTERSELLRRYVELQPASTLVAHLHMVIDRVQEFVPENEDIGDAINGDVWGRLNPVPDDSDVDPTDAPDFARAEALAEILAGELFLELASSSEELAAEGRRLVAIGRKQLRTSLDLDREAE